MIGFSKPAFIWTSLNVGIPRARRKEATIREFLPSGVQRWLRRCWFVLMQRPLHTNPWYRSYRSICIKILGRDHCLLLRPSAHFTCKILALGMISVRSTPTKQFPKLRRTLSVASLSTFIILNPQKHTVENFRKSNNLLTESSESQSCGYTL